MTEDLSPLQDQLIELCDDIVYEKQTVSPEDMFFICDLLEIYYKSYQDTSFESTQTCDIAWELAIQLKNTVEENPEVTWLNAFFIIDSLYQTTLDDNIEVESSQNSNSEVEHLNTFQYDKVSEFESELPEKRDDEEFESVVDEIMEDVKLYVSNENLQKTHIEEVEDGIPTLFELAIFFSSLKKRFARSFVDDMLESSISFKFTSFMVELDKREDVTPWEIKQACWSVREWASFKARREYESMVTTTESY